MNHTKQFKAFILANIVVLGAALPASKFSSWLEVLEAFGELEESYPSHAQNLDTIKEQFE